MISYTRNFEDVMICRALRHIPNGFYVDVGASHPVTDSNTFALYTLGWRGLAIEPQTIFNEQWQQYRPEDLLVNAGIANQEGQLTLYKPDDYGQGATFNAEFAQDYVQRGLVMSQHTVPVCPLTRLLEQIRSQGDIHLLSIDVEGIEQDVVLSLDWQRFRPWLVVLESTLPGVPTTNYQTWEPLLLAQGYEFVYFDAVNRFYIAQEHPELKAHFDHPPCVWDDFTPHELQFLRTRVPQLEQQISQQESTLKAAAQTLLQLALDLRDKNETVAFENVLWRIFELMPTYEDVYWPLGGLLSGQGRRAEALEFYTQAAQHAPHNFYNYHNLGMLLRWQKRWAESEAAFEQMMAINPNFHTGRRNYAMLHLALGNLTKGWELFESRYLPCSDTSATTMSNNAPYPMWRGESLEGKSIFVLREQGYGDAIMFARFIPQLKARGAAKVLLMCLPEVKTLLQTVEGVDGVYCVEDLNNAWPMLDYWIYEQSLPHALGITLDNLPAPIPYLSAQTSARLAWRSRIQNELPAQTLKIGLVWRGSAGHGNDRYRSLPSLSTLRLLWDIPNISFISLQKGAGEAEAQCPPQDQPLVNWGPDLQNFADSAALISELDLVISVDTSVVHLAGALGAACWVLVQYIETDWRWLTEREDSPWYPQGIRLFRQTQETAWDDVLENLKAALQTFVQNHPKLQA